MAGRSQTLDTADSHWHVWLIVCGRFSQSEIARQLVREFGLSVAAAPRPETWNLAPTTPALVVRHTDIGLSADWLTWGLKGMLGDRGAINARVETAGTKPLFSALWRERRCVVPADGWYEWRAENGVKQPYFFHRRDGQPIFLAGLWRGSSFVLMTTAADGALSAIHDRRPVALNARDSVPWIKMGAASPDGLLARLVPPEEIDLHPVSRRVSRADQDGPGLILPVSEREPVDPTPPLI